MSPTTTKTVYIGDTRHFRAFLSLASGASLDLSTTKVVATLSTGSDAPKVTVGNALAGLTGIEAVAPAETSMAIDITLSEAQTALLVPAETRWILEVVVEGADGFEHTVDDHPVLISKTRKTPAIV